MENGLAGETPCVVASLATRAEQQMSWSTIAALSDEDQLPAPSLLLVGRVASQKPRGWSGRLHTALFRLNERRELEPPAKWSQ